MVIARYILLAALPGLMFCIIPVEGTPFRFSWQLASLGLGGIAFAVFLSSWWWRGFYLLALARTMTLPPNYDAYFSLVTLTVFMAAAEGFSRIDPETTMDAMNVAALALLTWMFAQIISSGLMLLNPSWGGWFPSWWGTQYSGPFNPDTASVFLAMCLPACLRERRGPLIPFILTGLAVVGVTTGAAAAIAAGAVYLWLTVRNRKRLAAWGAAIAIAAGLWFWQVDPIARIPNDKRWPVWKCAAWSMRSEMWGRGLGSWAEIFPLLASGEPRLGTVTLQGETAVITNYFGQAHNEYVQAAFELGIQAVLLIAAFLVVVAMAILRGSAPPLAAAGIAALAVGCFGFFTFHVAPSALLGCAWLGIWRREFSTERGGKL